MALVPGVDHRELGVQDVVHHALAGLASGEVKAPLVELVFGALGANGEQQALDVQAAVKLLGHGVRRAQHDDFGFALVIDLFPSIGHMQHVARVGFKPADVLRAAVARDDGKTRLPLGVKFQAVTTRLQGLGVVDQREVMQDAVVGRDGHVVRQTGARQFNRNQGLQLAAGAHRAVMHVGVFVAIGKKHVFARAFIHAGVRRNLQTLQTWIRFQLAHGLQRHGVHLVNRAASVPHGEQFAVVVFHIGVGCVFQGIVWQDALGQALLEPWPQAFSGGLIGPQTFGVDPSVAVSDLAVAEMHGMQHAIAVVPVVFALGGVLRNGSVAHVHATEVFGNLANHLEIADDQLFLDRRKTALEVGVVDEVRGYINQCFKSHGVLRACKG